MTKKEIIIVIISVITLNSCSSSGDTKNSNLSGKMEIDSSYVKNEYAFIKNITLVNDTIFVNADFIQYLTGQAAIDAARKDGEADTFVDNKGDTIYAVPNDYYIVNENNKIRRIPLSKTNSFELIINPDRKHPIYDNSLKSFKKIYTDSPFILTLRNNEIIKIKELFLP